MKSKILKSAVTHALGKLPANPKTAPKLKFSDYFKGSLPTPPAQFGHETFIPSTGWGMLGNDQYGDCVCAGACHETMLWSVEGGAQLPAPFADKQALALYSAITGFKPNDPNTDQGTDMTAAASYRRKTGVKDASGKAHKVGAYLALKAGDLNEHLAALYLFGAVGIGINFPGSAMDQFNAGKPWDVVKGASIEGGHYIPLVAERGNLEIVTWGRLQEMTPKFFKKYNDESIAYLSPEIIGSNTKSPEGFDLAQLQSDLADLTA